jgi:GntR family galactonate operon transcriptional repressor
MLSKNVRRKLYEYVVDELGLQIIRGDYLPGDTLPNEDTLCKDLGVSRGVLREAVKVLIQKGLLESRTRTGTLIRPRSCWNLFDPDVLIWKYQTGNKLEFLQNIMEVRRIIEAEATKLTAERASAEDIERIRSIHDDMTKTIANGSSYADEDFILIDLKFHTAILEACGNELIVQIGHTMRQALVTARQSDRHDLEAQKAVLPSHLMIVNAIVNHDSEEAYRAAQEHIEHVWRDMQKKVSNEMEAE